MKRNIEVKEKALIDRLNDSVTWNNAMDKLPKTPAGQVKVDFDPIRNMTEDEKQQFNDFGPCSVEDIHRDTFEDSKEARTSLIRTGTTTYTPIENSNKEYEYVNHPKHYNNYDVEVIDMMQRIFGIEATYYFALLNAFKSRMRAGTKPKISVQQDLDKEEWYLTKAEELKAIAKALNLKIDFNKIK